MFSKYPVHSFFFLVVFERWRHRLLVTEFYFVELEPCVLWHNWLWISDTALELMVIVPVILSHIRGMQLQLCGGLRQHCVQPDISDPLQKWGDYSEWLYDLQSSPAVGWRKGESFMRVTFYVRTQSHTHILLNLEKKWNGKKNRECLLAVYQLNVKAAVW